MSFATFFATSDLEQKRNQTNNKNKLQTSKFQKIQNQEQLLRAKVNLAVHHIRVWTWRCWRWVCDGAFRTTDSAASPKVEPSKQTDLSSDHSLFFPKCNLLLDTNLNLCAHEEKVLCSLQSVLFCCNSNIQRNVKMKIILILFIVILNALLPLLLLRLLAIIITII